MCCIILVRFSHHGQPHFLITRSSCVLDGAPSPHVSHGGLEFAVLFLVRMHASASQHCKQSKTPRGPEVSLSRRTDRLTKHLSCAGFMHCTSRRSAYLCTKSSGTMRTGAPAREVGHAASGFFLASTASCLCNIFAFRRALNISVVRRRTTRSCNCSTLPHRLAASSSSDEPPANSWTQLEWETFVFSHPLGRTLEGF